MTTIPFYTPMVDFIDDDIGSATRFNQMLGNIDAVYGLTRRMSIGQTYGHTDAGAGMNEWRGWVAHHGNQLTIYLQEPGTVEFDATSKHQKRTFTYGTMGLKVISLPASYGYTEFECYCIRVDSALPPLYAYMSKNDMALIPTLPTFVNGTVPHATDFNAVRLATERLAEQFNQPITGGSRWSSGLTTPSWLNDQNPYSIEFWAEYRHPRFEYYATATPSGGSSGAPTDTLAWEVIGNTGGWDDFDVVTIPRPSPLVMTTPRNVALPAWNLTIGNWYNFKFTHNANEGNGKSNLYFYGQVPASSAGLWTPQDRWDMGDVANGSTGGPPKLKTMSDNLTYLNGLRYTTNPVMRQSRQLSSFGERTEVTFSRRIHRWLAYENDLEGTTPTLLYTTSKPNVFESVTMPVSYTTVYFDLDQSPIKPGMTFYAVNCQYAIQVSDHP